MDANLDREQEFGRFLRLQRELIEAYTAKACQNGLIERLTDELASLQHYLHRRLGDDEQSSDTTMPGLTAD